MSDHITNRKEVILKSLKEELIGPSPQGKEIDCTSDLVFSNFTDSKGPWKQKGVGEEILQRDPPVVRYGVGVLYPLNTDTVEIITSENDGNDEQNDELETGDFELISERANKNLEVIAKRSERTGIEHETEDFDLSSTNSFKPSSMGISFLAEFSQNTALIVEATGGRYRGKKVLIGEKERKWWLRSPVKICASFSSKDICNEKAAKIHPEVFETENTEGLDVRIELFSRPAEGSCRLITVCLVNRTTEKGLDEGSIFQTHFKAWIRSDISNEKIPVVLPYPRQRLKRPDQEEETLELLYSNAKTYAVGHGCAAEWGKKASHDNAVWVSAECLPYFEDSSITPEIFREDGTKLEVDMRPLAGLVPGNDGFEALEEVMRLYEIWISKKEKEILNLPVELRDAAVRNIRLCRRCYNRMRNGLCYLKKDEEALKAFRLANHAILLQQLHSRRESRKVSFDNDLKRWVFVEEYKEPDILRTGDRGKWRPFQIAFLLMCVESAVIGDIPDRETVELIWFPTGGGKTEAYLGLAAYSMFVRRIKNPDDYGVHVLMRYTLRLLTAQQFQRAAGLLCAMEHLRQKESGLGPHKFSIGIWLGSTTTPNSRKDAVKALRKLNRGDNEKDNPFILRRCPWCGAQMGRYEGSISKKQKIPKVIGYEEIGGTVTFKCADQNCQFNDGLPIYVIDEDIYVNKPTLVIGTVDKFAMLAWRPEARALFGIADNGERFCSPPGLIIQDELHLISGPLGSMCGLYETVIEDLCTDDRGPIAIKPKIVCSTATIRRYEEQIKALYGRTDSVLFPAPGLNAGDSFFSKYARDSEGKPLPGRIFAGVHAPGLGSMQTTQVRTLTSLIQAPIPLKKEDRDPWWTLLLFFNSLRELGTTLTLFQSDIPDYRKAVRYRTGVEPLNIRKLYNILELTGRLKSEEVPEAIERLELPTTSKGYPVDVCLASNIIEVGVDIDRLSLMCIVGQPKTTSQYIQVAGRVGRRWEQRPGLVVTLYSASKPRDRSHFEKFRSYHERLYAQVEPTSVTPFSPPALDRALHAVLTVYARQRGDLNKVNSPYPYPDEICSKAREIILRRVAIIDSNEQTNAEKILDKRLSEWKRWDRLLWQAQWSDPEIPLLREAGAYVSRERAMLSWPTPKSMRNVDSECQANITSLYIQEGAEDNV